MKTAIDVVWGSLEAYIMPAEAGQAQRDEMRKAFFAGAKWMVKLAAEEDPATFLQVCLELDAFFARPKGPSS